MCVDKEGDVLVAVDKTENATLADAMDCSKFLVLVNSYFSFKTILLNIDT